MRNFAKKIPKAVSNLVNNHLRITSPRPAGNKTIDIPLCGLCGNSGIIELAAQDTLFGTVIPARRYFCLFPNGPPGLPHL